MAPRDLFKELGIDPKNPAPATKEEKKEAKGRDLFKEFGITPPPRNYSWSEVPGAALRNAPGSAGEFVSNIAEALLHPVETAKAVGQVAAGGAAKLGIGDADTAAFDNLTQFFVDRYGSVEGVKRTLAEDPVGFLADLSTVLTAGGAVGARVPGLAGQFARAARRAGDMVDPVSGAVKTTGAALRGLGAGTAHLVGRNVGVSGETIKEMARAGREGNRSALEQLRNTAPASDIPDSANRALDVMRAERAAKYQDDIAPVLANQSRVSFTPVVREVVSAARRFATHKGQIVNREAYNTARELLDSIRGFQQAGFRTPGDFHAMKSRISEIRDATKEGTKARAVAEAAYNAVNQAIERAAPQYAVARTGYKADTEMINNLRKEFALTEKANPNTSARKLIAALRDNVNTNFGERARMMRELARREPNLPGMIAGRELSGWAPRGLARIMSSPTVWAPSMVGAYAVNPWLLAAMPFMWATSTPRVIGEAAYASGTAARHLNPNQVKLIGRMTYQAERAREADRKAEEDKRKKGR